MELVSVIIPCYNSGSTIKKTVDSILEQTWKNIELIIVDDGSNQKLTIDILRDFKFAKVYRQKNAGLPSARNLGIKKSKGQYILPIDADDWLDREAIKLMMNEIKKSKKPSFVFSNIKLEGNDKGILAKEYNFFDQLILNQLPYCILYPKMIWKNLKGYDESMVYGYEDWEFNIRMGLNGYHGIKLNQSVFHYFVSENGMLLSNSINRHSELWTSIQNKHKKIYKIKNLLNVWKNWKNSNSNHHAILYFLLYFFHKLIPKRIFNFFYLFSFKLIKIKRKKVVFDT